MKKSIIIIITKGGLILFSTLYGCIFYSCIGSAKQKVKMGPPPVANISNSITLQTKCPKINVKELVMSILSTKGYTMTTPTESSPNSEKWKTDTLRAELIPNRLWSYRILTVGINKEENTSNYYTITMKYDVKCWVSRDTTWQNCDCNFFNQTVIKDDSLIYKMKNILIDSLRVLNCLNMEK